MTGRRVSVWGAEFVNSFGACLLQHTDVDADIVGYITPVHVRQTFTNPLDLKIEDVYVLPLPQVYAVV